MTINEIFILLGGTLTLLMALFHTRFYTLFSWGADFKKMTEQNRRIIYTIHIALLLLFFALGAISLFSYQELARAQKFTQIFLLATALFWFWRAVWQLFYFKPSRNRKMKKMIWMHYILTIWFFTLCLLYLIPTGLL